MPLRDIPAGLQSHLEQETTTLATCWQITRKDGTAFYFTDCDIPLMVDGNEYTPLNSGTSSAIENTSDPDPNNMEIEMVLDSEFISAEDLTKGFFDGAEVVLFIVNYKDVSQGSLILLRGYLGEIEMQDDYKAKAELQSLSSKLDQTIGRQYTQQCDAIFGDSRCGVDATGYTSTDFVVSTTSRASFEGNIVQANGYYQYGLVRWTGGNNNGMVMEVKEQAGATITLFQPMPYDIQVDDSYEIIAGCDKYFNTCKNKFNNVVNFRGFPHIPGRDKVMQYPDSKD